MIRQAALIIFLGYALAFPEPNERTKRSATENPIVTTPLGQIKGTVMTSRLGKPIYSFRGIRYAKAPVNELRFKVSNLMFIYDSWFRQGFQIGMTVGDI